MTSPSLYKVIEEYNCNKHGECRARVVHVFSMLKKGMEFRPVIFAKEHIDDLVKNKLNSKDPFNTAKCLMFEVLRIAKKFGLVVLIPNKTQSPKEFAKNNGTVQNWFESFGGTNFQNISTKQATTGSMWLGKLLVFDSWLDGHSITYKDPWLVRAAGEEVKEITVDEKEQAGKGKTRDIL